jgi:5-formaminoimidazole-4-carboxamide-1-beta-D-ribofuranosyl 5'-monophosphate synthetase
MSMALYGQNLTEHQWTNRVILIIANDSKSQTYASQIKEFNLHIQELEERKLITYKVLPHKHKLENSEGNSWVKGSELYIKYNTTNRDFKMILIGLDGRIKIEQNKLLTTKELFAAIDSMPMRRAELRNKP